VADARRAAALPAGDPRLLQALKPVFAASHTALLNGLNAVTAEHQRQSERQLHMLQTLQGASLAMVLATLLAEAVGIFKPMVDRIARYNAELRRAATTDPLTGAYNRRSFTDRALAELARGARTNRATSVLMIDADRFKAVNDTYGHGVGDVVLTSLCSSLAAALRPSDLLGRIGGEEFAVVLPETDLASAAVAAERLRSAAQAVRVPVKDGEISFTVSIGVTVLPPGDMSLKTALDRADAALYRAKSEGRNRVAVSAPPNPSDAEAGAASGPSEPVLVRAG
jgi:diguanylate cyclase (GGDEF)-like protein